MNAVMLEDALMHQIQCARGMMGADDITVASDAALGSIVLSTGVT